MLVWLRKFVNDAPAGKTLDSIGTIQAHLDFRRRLEDYVRGESQKPLPVIATCHAGCLLGKWLHGEGGRDCRDVDLINALCGSCEEFYEAATNAVLLMEMGQHKTAEAALESGGAISDASERFQLNLAKLHHHIAVGAKSRFRA